MTYWIGLEECYVGLTKAIARETPEFLGCFMHMWFEVDSTQHNQTFALFCSSKITSHNALVTSIKALPHDGHIGHA